MGFRLRLLLKLSNNFIPFSWTVLNESQIVFENFATIKIIMGSSGKGEGGEVLTDLDR
jgi:hypothetical protein